MDEIRQDLRYGLRMLVKRPGFTLMAVLTLALGIGGNSAIFSIVNDVLLTPLPYKRADRLVVMSRVNHETGNTFALSPQQFFYFAQNSRLIEGASAVSDIDWSGNLTGAGEPERVQGLLVSANFFSLLGVSPEFGREFSSTEEEPGQNRVVIISDGLWRRLFGHSEGLLGQHLTLNGESYGIVGVLPPNFQLAPGVDVWAPLSFDAKGKADDDDNFLAPVIARLKSGVTIKELQTELDGLATQAPSSSKYVPFLKVVTAKESLVQDIRPVLLVLLGAVGFILLIACANVANLLLVRAATRQQEIAVRLALGANRWRLVRQLLTEACLLSALGGALGLLFALWGKQILTNGLPDNLGAVAPQIKAPQVSMLLFTVAISLLTSLFFGLAPALKASNPHLPRSLKEEGRGAGYGSLGRRLRQSLVIAEVALALVMLVGSALMLVSFYRLTRLSPGFNPRHVVTADVSLPESTYHESKVIGLFFREVLEKVEQIPGVASASAVNYLPLSGSGMSNTIIVEGRPARPSGQDYNADSKVVAPEYFRTLEIPLLRGRDFTDEDRLGAVPSVIISVNMADQLWPAESPIGKRIKIGNIGPGSPWMVIVGVVGNTKPYTLNTETPMQFYRPLDQNPVGAMSLVLRTSVQSNASIIAAVREQISQVDGNQPIFNIRTLEQVVDDSVKQQRLATILLGALGALALLLASIGIYGVLSNVVSQRNYEIGVRMALGAGRRDVLRLIVGQGMALVLIGVAIGLAGAWALTRLMSALLFGVTATDPATFITVSAFLSVVALFACYLPARRASRIDPVAALRYN